jgi:hypothetical protein
MTTYDLLKLSESVLNTLRKNGVSADDVRHLECYEELARMEREGHKKTFIVAYLSERYNLNEATLYRIANRMKKEIFL